MPPVDFLGNVLSLPQKLLLWSWKFNRHSISPETEQGLIAYLDARKAPAFEGTVFRLNQYRPVNDLSRLRKNPHVAWPYRLTIGLLTTLIFDVCLPGRLFPWGDYYNPWTNTAHLYSDHPAISMHEAGHAYDSAQQTHQGTYALGRMLPGVDIYQEWQATGDTLRYLRQTEQYPQLAAAYKMLYPALGTYVGNYAPGGGSIVGALVGHAAGRTKARQTQQRMMRLAPAPSPQPAPTP